MKSLIAFLTTALMVANAHAQSLSTKIHNPYSSMRALGMGNAFTAVADDYSLILYNPAGFARKKHNEIQITLAGAGVSDKTLKIADDIKKAADTPGSDSDKAQAVSDELEKYYGDSLGGKVQALEMFWVNKGWGVALVPADLTIDMTINRQVGPALDLNVKGDSILALGFGKSFSDEFDAGLTAKYVHRVSVEEIVPAFELATDSNVLSSKRFREGTKFDFDLGFMWTPKWFGSRTKTVKVKAPAPEASAEATDTAPTTAAPAEPVKSESIPAETPATETAAPAEPAPAPEANAETAAEPEATAPEAAPTPEPSAPAEASSPEAEPAAPADESGTRTPQQASEETPPEETAPTAEASPEAPAEEPAVSETAAPSEPTPPTEAPPTETPATAESAAPAPPASAPPGATPVPVPPASEVAPLTETEAAQQQAAEQQTPAESTAPAEQEQEVTEEVVEVENEKYPLSFGLVVHNVIGGEFSQSKIVNKDATMTPEKLHRTYDVGMQYKIVNWDDFTVRYMLDFRNMGYPGATKFNKIVHTGIEFDYSPSTWFKTQLRAGLNQTYFTAGASFLFGILNIDVVTYGEEVGTLDQKRESRVTAAKIGFNF